MRILLQILGLLIIIWMGWEQPFRDVVSTVCPWTDIAPSHLAKLKAAAAAAAAAATPAPRPVSPPRPRAGNPLDSPRKP